MVKKKLSEMLSKEVLTQLYCYDNLSDTQIAEKYNCNHVSIVNLRKKYEIKKLFRDKDWLDRKYNNLSY